jgi:hypothetical protein
MMHSHHSFARYEGLGGLVCDKIAGIATISRYTGAAIGRLPVACSFCGPIVYRLGHQVFILESRVRFPVGLPHIHNNILASVIQ